MSLLRSLRKGLTCVGLVSALCVVAYFLGQFIYDEEQLHDAEVKRVRHTRGLQSVCLLIAILTNVRFRRLSGVSMLCSIRS